MQQKASRKPAKGATWMDLRQAGMRAVLTSKGMRPEPRPVLESLQLPTGSAAMTSSSLGFMFDYKHECHAPDSAFLFIYCCLVRQCLLHAATRCMAPLGRSCMLVDMCPRLDHSHNEDELKVSMTSEISCKVQPPDTHALANPVFRSSSRSTTF